MSKGTFKEFDLFSIFSPIWESRGSKIDFLQLCHILSCNTSKCADFLSEKQRMGVFVKIFHFWPILCPFLAKLSPKVTFSLKHGAFFTGRYHMGFKNTDGFGGDIGKHIQSCVVSEFAF